MRVLTHGLCFCEYVGALCMNHTPHEITPYEIIYYLIQMKYKNNDRSGRRFIQRCAMAFIFHSMLALTSPCFSRILCNTFSSYTDRTILIAMKSSTYKYIWNTMWTYNGYLN